MLLLDTYDTEAAARKVVALAPRLKAAGIAIRGVRLDSAAISIALSKSVRRILDRRRLARRDDFRQRRPRRGFACRLRPRRRADRRLRHRHRLTTSSDAPALDCVYKLQEYAGIAAAQALGEQSDLARPQAGVAAL